LVFVEKNFDGLPLMDLENAGMGGDGDILWEMKWDCSQTKRKR